MDWELVFYIVLAIIFIITSAFRGKKKYEQEGEMMEQQEAEENEHINRMFSDNQQQAAEAEAGHRNEAGKQDMFEKAQKTMETELQQEVTTAKDVVPTPSEEGEVPEIEEVKSEMTKKKKTILDLRKAVIYQTILNRKYR